MAERTATMMELGHLKIPKPPMEKFAFVHDIQSKLFMIYSKLIEKNAPFENLVIEMENDSRVARLKNQMISNGNGAFRFEVSNLVMWYLWAANEFGPKVAEKNLNDFLDSENIPVWNTLWVMGIQADDILEFGCGAKLIPLQAMPDSRDKELFSRYDTHSIPFRSGRPGAALVFECSVPKTFSNEVQPEEKSDSELRVASRLLYDLSYLLNLIDHGSCRAFYSTCYSKPGTPFGPFSGSAGGMPIYDIQGTGSARISGEVVPEIDSLVSAFLNLEEMERTKYSRILSRLAQSKRREQIDDKLLDLGIALEMALLDDNTREQLSLTFRLRGAYLIGQTCEERCHVFKELKDIYNYRSTVAHSGVLGGGAKVVKMAREKFDDYSCLAAKLIKARILNPNVDWNELILGEDCQDKNIS